MAPKVDCSEDVTYGPAVNNTRTITHEFKIDNMDNNLAVIKVIDLRDIVLFGANSSSIAMVRNGTAFNAFGYPTWSEVVPMFAEIPPGHQVIFEVSFRGRS